MPNAKRIQVVFVYDPQQKPGVNADGHNYWYEYIHEINEQLGLRAQPLAPEALDDLEQLTLASALILGGLPGEAITDVRRTNLQAWVKAGGVLIGLGCDGLDELFGLKYRELWEQPTDDYTLGGFLVLQEHPLCAGVPSPWHPEQKLLVFSSTRLVSPVACQEVARFQGHDHSDEGFAGITARPLGSGWACYFAFDLPKTLWVLHQGRPMEYEKHGFGYYRTSHQIVIGSNHPEVPYADSLLFVLQNMLGLTPQPFIYQLPPVGEQAPEAGFFWGGDKHAGEGEAEMAVWASDFMKEQGLPYHINLAPLEGGGFISQEDFNHIQANGHECAPHFSLFDYKSDAEAFRITPEDIREQAEAFRAEFGQDYIASVNCSVRWAEGAEMAVWMQQAGGKADNSFIHEECTVWGGDPHNRFGFSFGTCYPFYFYRDYRHGNERVDFLEEPIIAYEVGYAQRRDEAGVEIPDLPRLRRALDMALYWHLLMNMFYHPRLVYQFTTCQQAIKEAVRYLRETGKVVVHLAPDGVWRWWDRRGASTVASVEQDGDAISFHARCEYPGGMIVKVPLGGAQAQSASCDGAPAAFSNRRDFGQNWAFVIVPEGEHEMKVRWQRAEGQEAVSSR